MFDHFDNTLLVLSATTGGVSVASFVTVIGAAFWVKTTSLKMRKKKKEHKKIISVARCK